MTEREALILSLARTVLRELGATSGSGLRETDKDDDLSLGRFAEACDIAESAVFNVLNVGSSYLDDREAKRVIDNQRREASAVTEGGRKWLSGK
jgi:hypothetical protein